MLAERAFLGRIPVESHLCAVQVNGSVLLNSIRVKRRCIRLICLRPLIAAIFNLNSSSTDPVWFTSKPTFSGHCNH